MLDFILGGIFQKIGIAMAAALLSLGGNPSIPSTDIIPGEDIEPAPAAEILVSEIREEEPEPVPKPNAAPAASLPPPPTDACSNIGDVQKKVPEGLLAVNGICLPEEDVDRCLNLEGIQGTVPAGLVLYKSERACLTEGQIERLEEKTKEETTSKKSTLAKKPTTSEPKDEESETEEPVEEFIDKDCGDFATHAEAQAFFETEGGPEEDPHKLDGNNHNGLACESLP